MHRELADIDLNQLRHLDVLLEEQSVAKAARRMGVSSSAMSRTLGRLREHRQDPLLAPHGRALVRTPYADRLRRPVRRILDELRQTLRPARFHPATSTSTATFTLASTDYTEALVLPELLRTLSRQAPGGCGYARWGWTQRSAGGCSRARWTWCWGARGGRTRG